MKLSMTEEKALADLADRLYSFLPASGYGPTYTFGDAARDAGVGDLWPGVKGTGLAKSQALTTLLERTLAVRRGRFCTLIEQIVRAGLKYRMRRGNPLTAVDIKSLNDIVLKFGFRIPDLWDPKFLASLPPGNPERTTAAGSPPEERTAPSGRSDMAFRAALDAFRTEFLELHSLSNRQEAGRRLESVLHRLFVLFDLEPSGGFRVAGEQIDGSIEFEGDVYLVEAKWTQPVDEAALLVLRGKIEGKSQFTRGVFVSINGYTEPALRSITQGKSPNFVMLDGSHLYRVLEGSIRLDTLLRRVVRHVAQTGEPYLPIGRM